MSNWQPVLLSLVQSGRKVDAIKLWRTVRGIDFERAMHEIDDVCSYRRSFPDASEHPDLPDEVLSVYRNRLNTLPEAG